MSDLTVLLASQLSEIILRNSAEWVTQKIDLARKKKDLLSQQNDYEAIITNLLSDKLELQRITAQYKDLYEGLNITDKDIDYLHNTLTKVFTILLSMDPNSAERQNQISALISLLDKDLLKSMQLLGFNYKEAIGKPLTEICSARILDWGIAKQSTSLAQKKK